MDTSDYRNLFPGVFHGNLTSVRQAANLYARKLCDGTSLEKIQESHEMVPWNTIGSEIVVDHVPSSFMEYVSPEESTWRIYLLGDAMKKRLPSLINRYIPTGSERADPIALCSAIDSILLPSMDYLWFTIATLNINWDMFWLPAGRPSPVERAVAASQYLAKYDFWMSALYELQPHFRSTYNSPFFGAIDAKTWQHHIVLVASYVDDERVIASLPGVQRFLSDVRRQPPVEP